MRTAQERRHSQPQQAVSDCTISARVYERLRDDIISGTLKPSSRLTLERLKSLYAVSMTPLREALYRLTASQLIVGEDRRGFWVAPATAEHLEEILYIRQHIEALVLRSAFQAGDLAWEARVLAAFHRLRGTPMYEDVGDAIRSEWELAHREFHQAVLSTATLPMLLNFQNILWDHAARYRNLVRPAQLKPEILLQEHGQILDAVLTRDADMACMALRRHIRKAGELVLAGMR